MFATAATAALCLAPVPGRPQDARPARAGQQLEDQSPRESKPQSDVSPPPAERAAGASDDAADAAAIRFLEARVKEFPEDPSVPTRLAAALLERAKRTSDYKLFARAEAACREALKRDPEHAGALALLGAAHLAQHRFREAANAAEHMLAVRPGAPEALALRGDARLQLGDHAGARADYEKFLAAKPDLLSHARMANLQFAEGNATDAASSLEAGLRAGEDRAAPPALMAWGLVRLGELRFRAGDWEAADRWYTRAIELDGDDPDALEHKAELHAARGEHEVAIKLLKAALALSPRPEFHHNLGDVCAAAGDARQALRSHGRALAAYLEAAEGGHAHYYHHLAGLYCDVDAFRDPREAERWARKDLHIRRTVATLDALAWALYHAGRNAEAAAAMDEALRQGTADAHVLYHASLIYSRAGDADKGRLHLRRAASANPKFNAFHFHR